MTKGLCLLYLSVRGSDSLALTEVFLNACVFRNEPVHGQGIMFAVDGIRYVFHVGATVESIGTYSYDHYIIPLDAEGLGMVNELAAHGGIVYAYGSGKPYTDVISEGALLKNSLDMLPEWYDDYSLWIENAAYWPDNRPFVETVVLNSDSSNGFNDAGLVDTNDKVEVAHLQELLKENGLFSKNIDGKYGSDTVAAVKNAQHRCGYIETGIADLRLIEALSGEACPDAEHEAVEFKAVGLTPISYRICGAICPCAAYNTEDAERIAASSNDLVLVAVEGVYTCTAAEAQDLALECEAWIVVDGIYRYPCSVRCEYPGGTAYGTKTSPLQSVRVFWIAEMPESAARGRELELKYIWFSEETVASLE